MCENMFFIMSTPVTVARFTDDVMLKALKLALKTASVQPIEVAEHAGCSPRYAKDRLREMLEAGLIDGKIIGNVWTYRLKK